MAETLVESMSGDFDPSEYTDDYQIELKKMLEDAVEAGGKAVIPATEAEEQEEDAEVVDLVAALQRSVDAAAGKKSSGDSSSTKPAKKAPAKKATTTARARKGA